MSHSNLDCGIEYYNGAVVKRVAVTPGTTITISGYTSYIYKNSISANYYAGDTYYLNHSVLGNIPSPQRSSHYKIYADTNSGNPYVDSTTATKYKGLTGSTIG